MAKKTHWAASTDDPTAGRKFRLACGMWAWINSAKESGPLWSLCSAAVYRDLAACDPDWYCSDCARAARLALAKESAPKPEPLAPVVSWPEPRPIADFPIDRPVPVFVPSLGWAIGTALGVCWDAASKKHVATSIVTTDGTVVSPTHFLPIVLPLPPSPEVR